MGHKNIFNKNKRCREIKTPKAYKQCWEVNVGPKIKQTTSSNGYVILTSPIIGTSIIINMNNYRPTSL